MIALLPFLLAAAAPATPTADRVEQLRQAIWSACDGLPTNAADAAPIVQGSAACDARREPMIDQLWQIGRNDTGQAGITALGLVAAWAPPPRAQAALDTLALADRDNPSLAPVLESAMFETRAPDKRRILVRLTQTSRSRNVAGSAAYLVAADTLARSNVTVAERARALAMLHRVAQQYAAISTTLLGAGDPPRLGRAAAALVFRNDRLRPGKPLPPMSAVDLEGHKVSSASFHGKVTLIDFWATWCPPCVAAMPTLRQVQASHHRDTFQIVSISGDADPATARAFVERNHNVWPQWRAGPGGVVSAEWSNTTFPYYLLVDAAGRIMAADGNLKSVLVLLPTALHRADRH